MPVNALLSVAGDDATAMESQDRPQRGGFVLLELKVDKAWRAVGRRGTMAVPATTFR